MSFPTPPGYKPGGITSFLVKRDGNDAAVGLAQRPIVAVPRRRPGRPKLKSPPQPLSQLPPGDSGGEAVDAGASASATVGDSPDDKPLPAAAVCQGHSGLDALGAAR